MSMKKLTTPQVKILGNAITTGKEAQRLLRIFSFVFIILLFVNLYLRWEFPATFIIGSFTGFMVVMTIIQYFMYQKIVLDLANGESTLVDGVIAKKEVKQGPNSYNDSYTNEALEEIAKFIEEKEKGTEKDYRAANRNLKREAGYAFHLILKDGSVHAVNIRDYIDLNVGDNVRITLTPRSRTFLSISKV
jgi:hypothetical protein